jgi:hypothetical protein
MGQRATAASDQYTLKLVLWSAMNVCETGYVADVHVKMYIRHEGSVINKVLRSSIVSLSSSLGAANSSDPEFNEPFVLDVPSSDASLVLAIYDTDYMRDDDMLGAIVVPTSSLVPPEAHPDKDGLVNVDFVLQPSETQKKRTEVASYFTVQEAERIRLRVSCCMHHRTVHTSRRTVAGTRRRLPSAKLSSRGGASLWDSTTAKKKVAGSAGKKQPSVALKQWRGVLQDVGVFTSPRHSPQRIGGAAPAATAARAAGLGAPAPSKERGASTDDGSSNRYRRPPAQSCCHDGCVTARASRLDSLERAPRVAGPSRLRTRGWTSAVCRGPTTARSCNAPNPSRGALCRSAPASPSQTPR